MKRARPSAAHTSAFEMKRARPPPSNDIGAPPTECKELTALVDKLVGPDLTTCCPARPSDEMSKADWNMNMNPLSVNTKVNAKEYHHLSAISPCSSCGSTSMIAKPAYQQDGRQGGNISPISEASDESDSSEAEDETFEPMIWGGMEDRAITSTSSSSDHHEQATCMLASDREHAKYLPDQTEMECGIRDIDNMSTKQFNKLFNLMLKSICSPSMTLPSRRKHYTSIQLRLRQLRLRTSDVSGSYHNPEEELPN